MHNAKNVSVVASESPFSKSFKGFILQTSNILVLIFALLLSGCSKEAGYLIEYVIYVVDTANFDSDLSTDEDDTDSSFDSESDLELDSEVDSELDSDSEGQVVIPMACVNIVCPSYPELYLSGVTIYRINECKESSMPGGPDSVVSAVKNSGVCKELADGEGYECIYVKEERTCPPPQVCISGYKTVDGEPVQAWCGDPL